MSFNAYATSLRGERVPHDRVIEDGVPFFVPQLSKVKTNVMCQSKNQHLLFCFEKASGSEATLASASYRKQGNQDLYSPENLSKRQRLQDETSVVVALARFWDTFPHIRQGAQSLDCRDYVDVFMKFYKALVSPCEFSMAEARRIVERDWERDMGAADTMTRAVFFHALFEVADIWTVGIGADIYASFLNKLYDRVTMKVYDKEKCVWLTVFADIDKIRPFDESPADANESLLPSSSTSAASNVLATNQDGEMASPFATPSSTVAAAAAASAATIEAPSASIPKSKPPLLKKKMLSMPNGLGSPTKTSAISMLPSAEAMGGSMRRLPDLQAAGTEAVRTTHHGIASRGSKSPLGQPADGPSSRSDGHMASVTTRLDSANESSGASGPASKAAMQSATNTRLSTSPTRLLQRSASTRRDGAGAIAGPSQRKKDDDTEPAQGPLVAPQPPEIPPQQVRLLMPSIYLSPEITQAHNSEKAAQRRIRESMKLAQRLRRITF